jgi:hypothetical protein
MIIYQHNKRQSSNASGPLDWRLLKLVAVFKTRVAVSQASTPLSYASLRRHDTGEDICSLSCMARGNSCMGIVYPSSAVARRWDGALQARLRRAPLEAFLRGRSLVPAPAGVSQDSDNLVRATVLIVEAGLSVYFTDRVEGLAFHQRAVVGHVACLVSRALADQISQPDAWRIVALVSTARLLSPWIGLNAAAMASAGCARQFQEEFVQAASPLDRRISESACAAINRAGPETLAEVSASIAMRLNIGSSPHGVCVAQDVRELYAALSLPL